MQTHLLWTKYLINLPGSLPRRSMKINLRRALVSILYQSKI